MYHARCHSNGQALAGRLRKRRTGDWSRVYMGMDENTIVARFRQYRPQASDGVKDIGATFAILQEHRDRAMERPGSTYLLSEIAQLMQWVEGAITAVAGHQPAGRKSARQGLDTGIAPGPGSIWTE